MAELVAETAIMKIFDHPNVLQLLGVCVDSNDHEMLRAVLPYMANGDLRNFLKQKRLDPANISEFANVCYFVYVIYIIHHIYICDCLFKTLHVCIKFLTHF